MRRIAFVSTLALIAGALVIAPDAEAGKKKKKKPKGSEAAPTTADFDPSLIKPKPGMYLRTAFDTDPSSYIGRFVPEGMTDLDESKAMKMSCSKHITYKKIGAGGITYDEVYQASSGASAAFGIPGGPKIGGGMETGSSVRVKYTLISKMVADIEDPDAMRQCCEAGSTQCTETYLSEFYEGTGQLFYAAATSSGGSMKGGVGGVGTDVDIKNGVAWSKSIEFTQPIYFAFKTTPNPYMPKKGGCGDWVNAAPKSPDGQYFVGLGDPVNSERIARDQAMKNARVQTVKYIGEQIAAGSIDVTVVDGVVGDLDAQLNNKERIESFTKGVASLIKDEAWCVTQEDTPDGNLFNAKVLAFFPNKNIKDALKKLSDTAKGEGGE